MDFYKLGLTFKIVSAFTNYSVVLLSALPIFACEFKVQESRLSPSLPPKVKESELSPSLPSGGDVSSSVVVQMSLPQEGATVDQSTILLSDIKIQNTISLVRLMSVEGEKSTVVWTKSQFTSNQILLKDRINLSELESGKKSLLLIVTDELGNNYQSELRTINLFNKVPFRTHVNHDLTNILSTQISGLSSASTISEKLNHTIKELVDSKAGAMALAPGMGRVPLWKSRVLPVEDQIQFYKDQFNYTVNNGFLNHIIDGGDFVVESVEAANSTKLLPIISLRLNDSHFLSYVEDLENYKLIGNGVSRAAMTISPFYFMCPELRIGDQSSHEAPWIMKWPMDWSVPSSANCLSKPFTYKNASTEKLELIKEVSEARISGIELDFLRAPAFFKDGVNPQTRKAIMAAFIGAVKQIMNSRNVYGDKRYLGVRIPHRPEVHEKLGIDLKGFENKGVDYFIFGSFFLAEQPHLFLNLSNEVSDNLKDNRAGLSKASAFWEMHYTNRFSKQNEDRVYRFTTRAQYYAASNMAYRFGFQGISLFNFQYYRPHGSLQGHEPPFDMVNCLNTPSCVNRKDHHYYIAGHGSLGLDFLAVNKRLPRDLKSGQDVGLSMNMAPHAGGWSKNMKLRIQSNSLINSDIRAEFNGMSLVSTSFDSPVSTEYPQDLGVPEQYRSWSIPPSALRLGRNNIQLSLKNGPDARIIWVEILAPYSP